MNCKMKRVNEVVKDFTLSNEDLRKVSNILLEEFKKGLGTDTHSNACVKMFPTYVRDIPNGSEEGTFLALDLGGSKFRVLKIDLKGEYCCMSSEIYNIPQSVMEGPGEKLFEHIAICLEDLVKQMDLETKNLPLGFTFSFPCLQKSLTSAVLVSWTKGFTCSGVVGKDIVQLLNATIVRRGIINVEIIAVINDTTGTLISCAHRNKNCRIGLIVGTGCNACYMEHLENVGTWDGNRDEPDQVIINTEWGAFGDNGCCEFIRTSFDRQLDENSKNRGNQLFEKMISGMYLGEIVRRIVVKLGHEAVIFKGFVSLEFSTPYKFKSKYVSDIEKDDEDSTLETKIVIGKMGIHDASQEDCNFLKQICCCVSTRSAHLVSAAVSTILNKMKRPHTVVGVDGSVYRYHPHFKRLMEAKIKEMSAYNFELMLSEDGSGRGAALVAAVAARVNK